ncbi:phosphate ABC transporter substrate-binding protein [Vibrio sp. UCD-FRSSP16_10]|uniref:phosphate ABC transporter substrate-binding protein n=1 Tax=unclassified Vibrio TaxID=2614977 RepID=UPI0008007B90|nr:MULTISPECIES: phosphate ABC transporter substrate-binding protein [unclassified Vibrio]OBT09445.1 phosphate ABC transporter substrate-binding protein [Vibrio sp. UCD-FRSSP16_30]OBT22124.1 phosphate ABC transporter substrate-binding protein [Vibrio sp. UCD-FRSSP16_10]
MFKVIITALTCLILSVANVQAAQVNVSGSTSVARVMDILAENFNQSHKDTFIAVQGVGSTAGIALVKNDVAQIGMSSRLLTEREYKDNLVVTQFAYDGLAVVVNQQNDITNITREQLYKIYTGEITNWKELGGNDRSIAVVTRETSSGSRYAFEDQVGLTRVLNDRRVSTISPTALVVSTNSMMKTLISYNQQAIGFISMGSIDASVKPLNFDGVVPNSINLVNKKYELARPFLIFHHQDLNDKSALEFAKYVNSSEARSIIENQGYTPYKRGQ